MSQSIEICILCNEPTGRAGRKDDSLYAELKNNFYSYKKGEEIGPLCLPCFDALNQLELIDEI